MFWHLLARIIVRMVSTFLKRLVGDGNFIGSYARTMILGSLLGQYVMVLSKTSWYFWCCNNKLPVVWKEHHFLENFSFSKDEAFIGLLKCWISVLISFNLVMLLSGEASQIDEKMSSLNASGMLKIKIKLRSIWALKQNPATFNLSWIIKRASFIFNVLSLGFSHSYPTLVLLDVTVAKPSSSLKENFDKQL